MHSAGANAICAGVQILVSLNPSNSLSLSFDSLCPCVMCGVPAYTHTLRKFILLTKFSPEFDFRLNFLLQWSRGALAPGPAL